MVIAWLLLNPKPLTVTLLATAPEFGETLINCCTNRLVVVLNVASLAVTACDPKELSRTAKVVPKVPVVSVVVVATDVPSTEMVNDRPAEKPAPLIDTVSPGCAVVTLRLITGVTWNVPEKLPIVLSTKTVYEPPGTAGTVNASEMVPVEETVPLLTV